MKFMKTLGMAVLIGLLMLSVPVLSSATSSTTTTGPVVTGSTTATGAAINVSLGFYPSVVVVSRVSGTAANNFQATYTRDMTSGYCILHTAGGLTYVTTACISTYAGTSTAAKGFTLGTNSSINPSSPADTLFWEAYK